MILLLYFDSSLPTPDASPPSQVYRETYQGRPVVIKFLATDDVEPDVIAHCCNEVLLLSQLPRNPNVVHCYGVTILPPR